MKNRKPMTLADYPQFHEAQRIAREDGFRLGVLSSLLSRLERSSRAPALRLVVVGPHEIVPALRAVKAEIQRLKGDGA